jgi:hypothetical protein
MTRWLLVGTFGLALAGCGQQQGASDAATDAADLAFRYSYTFRLPSAQIGDAQEVHASRCEKLGRPRCRITGMSYTVDGSGDVQASLSVAVASPLARRFGREGVAAVEQAGGALIGADISGTETLTQASAGDTTRSRGASELARLDAQLARTELSGPERAELTRQRAAAATQAQVGGDDAAAARAEVATTPIAFTYRAGRGVGPAAELAAAGQTAYASLLTTLSVLLRTLAVLGPPLLLGLLLFLLGRRWGVPVWRRLFPPRPRDADPTVAPAARATIAGRAPPSG